MYVRGGKSFRISPSRRLTKVCGYDTTRRTRATIQYFSRGCCRLRCILSLVRFVFVHATLCGKREPQSSVTKTIRFSDEIVHSEQTAASEEDNLSEKLLDNLLRFGGSQLLIDALQYNGITTPEFQSLNKRFFRDNGLALSDFSSWRKVSNDLTGIKTRCENRPRSSPNSEEGNLNNQKLVEVGVSLNLFKTDLRFDPARATPSPSAPPLVHFTPNNPLSAEASLPPDLNSYCMAGCGRAV